MGHDGATADSNGLNEAAIRVSARPASGARVLDIGYRGGLSVGRHDHEHSYLCLVTGGGFEESWRGGTRSAGPGSFLYFPAHVTHRGSYAAAGARVLHLEIPAGDTREACEGGNDVKVTFADLRDSTAAALCWQLTRELTDADVPGLVIDSLVADVLAEVFGAAPPRTCAAPSWLATIEEMLRAAIHKPPTLEALAAEVGRHPSHVARNYRRYTGSTIGQRARRLQAARAAAAIGGTEEPLAQIAWDAGFADQSHMSRTFRDLYGTTPAAYRRARRDQA